MSLRFLFAGFKTSLIPCTNYRISDPLERIVSLVYNWLKYVLCRSTLFVAMSAVTKAIDILMQSIRIT